MDRISGKSRLMAPSPSSQASAVLDSKLDRFLLDRDGAVAADPPSDFLASPASDFFRSCCDLEAPADVSRHEVRRSE
jgi:hypothetical protein